MAGLCKPYAAETLVKTLRRRSACRSTSTRTTSAAAQAASVLKAAEDGLDIADGAMASLSGLTSQPSLNALVESLRFTARDTGLDREALIELSRLLGGRPRRSTRRSRPACSPLGRGLRHEMPGGQYTNLYQQAKALGLAIALARGLQGVRRGQPAVRRHRQGDADLEGRRRHGPVHGRQQPDARRRARPRARAGVPRDRGRVLRGQARPAARRLPGRAAGARPQGPTRRSPTGPAPACRRPTSRPRARRRRELLGRPPPTATS